MRHLPSFALYEKSGILREYCSDKESLKKSLNRSEAVIQSRYTEAKKALKRLLTSTKSSSKCKKSYGE